VGILLSKPRKQFSLFHEYAQFRQAACRENYILETGYWHHAYGSVFASFLDYEDSPISVTLHPKLLCPDMPRFFCPGGKCKGFEICNADSLI